jgi:hypothetical protein
MLIVQTQLHTELPHIRAEMAHVRARMDDLNNVTQVGMTCVRYACKHTTQTLVIGQIELRSEFSHRRTTPSSRGGGADMRRTMQADSVLIDDADDAPSRHDVRQVKKTLTQLLDRVVQVHHTFVSPPIYMNQVENGEKWNEHLMSALRENVSQSLTDFEQRLRARSVEVRTVRQRTRESAC